MWTPAVKPANRRVRLVAAHPGEQREKADAGQMIVIIDCKYMQDDGVTVFPIKIYSQQLDFKY